MFTLTAAEILGDGMVLRLRFEAGVAVGQPPVNRLKDTGFRDYLPGLAAGLTVLANGQPAEIIGVNAEDWNMPVPWIMPPGSGGYSVPAGRYFFLIAIEDATGKEVKVGPPIWSYCNDAGEVGVDIVAGQPVEIRWREPVPVDGRVNVYACEKLPLVGNLRRIASQMGSSMVDPGKIVLTGFGGDGEYYVPQSTTWTVTCRLETPIAMGVPVVVMAPEGIVVDDRGNVTEAVQSYRADNLSIVGTNGFLATANNNTATQQFFFNQQVYLSFSRGNDSVGAGDGSILRPFKTMARAMAATETRPNICFRFLRGDTWPAEVWRRAYWGLSIDRPALFESYWNPAYGDDPGSRPIITIGDPYYDMATKKLDETAITFQGFVDTTGKTKGNGDRPYIYFRGLSFRADATYPNTGQTWPATTAEDFVVLSDCEFQNVCLVGTYGAAQKIAPIGCMVHRSILHSVHGSPANVAPDRGSGVSNLIFPDRFINPWAGYASSGINLITPGQTFIRFFNSGARWKVAGWKVTVSEGTKSETKTLTTHADGNGSYWYVDTPWTNTFTRTGCNISLDPIGQWFVLYSGTGASPTKFLIHSYDPTTRSAKVTPDLPDLDDTTRIAFCPLGYWDLGGHIQGFYASHCGDWLFSQSAFLNNGWNWPDRPDFNDIYCHNLYLSGMCRDVVTHGCYSIGAGSVGIQQRGGGVAAYNVFTENTHGICTSGDAAVVKNLFMKQGLYNDTLSTAPSHLPASTHNFNIFLASTGSLENRVPSQNYTGITAFNNDERAWAHSHVGFQHNTLVDAGSFRAGIRLPVPGKLHVHNNLFVNRPGTGVDYKGQPLQTAFLELSPGWNTNGAQTSDAIIANHVDYDRNAYRITDSHEVFAWPDYTGASFAEWQKTGRDVNSVLLAADPIFAATNYQLGSWSRIASRQEAQWADNYDAATCYRKFAKAYTPIGIPTVDSTRLGYYGVADYRPAAAIAFTPGVDQIQAASNAFAAQIASLTTEFAGGVNDAITQFVAAVSSNLFRGVK